MKHLKNILIIVVLIVTVTICSLGVFAPKTRAAANLQVSYFAHRDTFGFYWVFGEVKNVGETPATHINVTINAYDALNNLLASTYGSIDAPYNLAWQNLFVLLPGAKAHYTLKNMPWAVPQGIDHFAATVSFTESASIPVGLQVTNVDDSGLHDSGGGGVTCNITNMGASKANQVFVYISVYDSGGNVIGTGYGAPSTVELQSGENSKVSLIIIPPFLFSNTGKSNCASYMITAQSFVYGPGGMADTSAQYTVASETTGIVPEFPSFIVLPILMITTLVSVILYRRKQPWKKCVHATRNKERPR